MKSTIIKQVQVKKKTMDCHFHKEVLIFPDSSENNFNLLLPDGFFPCRALVYRLC
jgi:hypothetical protein